uniref:3-beta hydroxysteroid dehydrogenase/isomerase domain-containing protein n=1 Tax=Alexandrium monilatum TaxID=311494 RepID=A0A7S4VBN1_9DINO|mmetsp:Transcript_47949/g.143194  ORF Transcript_47949/g.143194 Transcript_47949/m.143194 type:complete len:430 (-) Transcript_47949:151-1440(-)
MGIALSRIIVDVGVAIWNSLVAPRNFYVGRPARQTDPNAHLACDEKWKSAVDGIKRSGDCYLVVGNGFLGRGIVRCLLERGETNIRVFDVAPSNVWQGNPHVTFIRGDVTKFEDISNACGGVQVVYSTYALIRFMDRLDFQASLSYRVNVGGMKTLLEAIKANSCERLIMTSTSNVCSDISRARPCLNLDESEPYTTPEVSPHHYAWTKAVSEQLVLKADGCKLANAHELQTVVVRPCGGLVGGNDGLTFSNVLDLGLVASHGSWTCDGFSAPMDYTYVDNVLLGHLLAEQALREGKPGIRGEAFNISNDDPLSLADLASLMQYHLRGLLSPQMRQRLVVRWICIPWWVMCPLTWSLETFKWLTRGRFKLPTHLDMVTPALLDQMNLGFTYSSQKARDRLGYAPVYTVDEAIQRSLHDYYRSHYPDKTA